MAGIGKKGKSYMALRKIRSYEDDFDPRGFASIAEEIYIKAHEALANRNEEELHQYATEKAFPVWHNHLICCAPVLQLPVFLTCFLRK